MWIFWESKKVCGEHCVLDNKPLNTLWSEARANSLLSLLQHPLQVVVSDVALGFNFHCLEKKKGMKSQKDLGSFCCQEKQAAACRGQFSCSRQDEPTSLFPEELGSPSCDVK